MSLCSCLQTKFVGIYGSNVLNARSRTWSTMIVTGTPPASTAANAASRWLTSSLLFATSDFTAPNVMKLTSHRDAIIASKSSAQVGRSSSLVGECFVWSAVTDYIYRVVQKNGATLHFPKCLENY